MANLSLKQLDAENKQWLKEKVKEDMKAMVVNPKSDQKPHPRKGEAYSEEEEHKIIEWILVRERLQSRNWSVGGNSIWRIMENQGALPGRSWQSSKERFRRVILRKMVRGGCNYSLNEEQEELLHKLRDFTTIRDNAAALRM